MKIELEPSYVKGIEVNYIEKGLQYEEALKATADMNFSAGIWYFVGGMGDRFSPAQTDVRLTIEEAIEFLYRIGVKGVSFHYPGEYTNNNGKVIEQLLKERGMRVSSVAANIFTALPFKYGGYTSHIPQARNLANKLKIEAQEICARLRCHHQTDWAGRDGSDGYLIYEQDKHWTLTRDSYIKMLLAVGGKSGIAIEFKPYDAMEHSVLKNIDDALRMCTEVEETIKSKIANELKRELGKDVSVADFEKELKKRFKPYDHSVGINIEDAHVYMAGYKVSDAVKRSLQANRLFLRHENDCEGRIDNDRIFGSIHFWDALEATYYQIIHRYDERGGFHEPDIFPQRDDPLKAYIQCLNAINFFYSAAQKLVENEKMAKRLDMVRKTKQASEANSLLFDLISEGVEYTKIPLSLAERFRKEIKK